RQEHADEYAKEAQEVILDADDFMIHAEDVLPNKAFRRMMRRVGYGRRHFFTLLISGAAAIISAPVPASTGRNRPRSLPAWGCASGSVPIRIARNRGPRRCRSGRPGTRGEFPCRAQCPA